MTASPATNGSARRHLPFRRKSFTVEAVVGGSDVKIGFGVYADGSLGEVWIDMHKYGATLRHWIGDTAQLFSIGLQYGIPLTELIKPFVHSRSDPCGAVEWTGNAYPNIQVCTSIMDLVCQVIREEFLNERITGECGS